MWVQGNLIRLFIANWQRYSSYVKENAPHPKVIDYMDALCGNE